MPKRFLWLVIFLVANVSALLAADLECSSAAGENASEFRLSAVLTPEAETAVIVSSYFFNAKRIEPPHPEKQLGATGAPMPQKTSLTLQIEDPQWPALVVITARTKTGQDLPCATMFPRPFNIGVLDQETMYDAQYRPLRNAIVLRKPEEVVPHQITQICQEAFNRLKAVIEVIQPTGLPPLLPGAPLTASQRRFGQAYKLLQLATVLGDYRYALKAGYEANCR